MNDESRFKVTDLQPVQSLEKVSGGARASAYAGLAREEQRTRPRNRLWRDKNQAKGGKSPAYSAFVRLWDIFFYFSNRRIKSIRCLCRAWEQKNNKKMFGHSLDNASRAGEGLSCRFLAGRAAEKVMEFAARENGSTYFPQGKNNRRSQEASLACFCSWMKPRLHNPGLELVGWFAIRANPPASASIHILSPPSTPIHPR